MNTLAASGILLFSVIAMLVVANRAIWWGLKQGKSPSYCIGLGTLSLLVFFSTTLILIKTVFHLDIIGIWQQEFESSLKMSAAVYAELGWEDAEIQQAVAFIRQVFLKGSAGWVVLFSMAFSSVGYWIVRRMHTKLPGAAYPVLPFSYWRVPEQIIWFFLATLLAVVAGSRTGGWIGWVGLNAGIVCGGLYLLNGLAVAMFFLEKRKIPRFFKVLLVFLLGFVPALMVFIILLGLFDTWWDWRKVRRID